MDMLELRVLWGNFVEDLEDEEEEAEVLWGSAGKDTAMCSTCAMFLPSFES